MRPPPHYSPNASPVYACARRVHALVHDATWLATVLYVCLFIVVYVSLDILSGPEARYQAIAPVWHPAAGLATFAILRYGKRAVLTLLAAALLAAAITPAVPARVLWSLAVGLLPLPAYVVLGLYMRRFLAGGAFFASHRGLLLWAAAVTIGSLLNAVLYAQMVQPGDSGQNSTWIALLTRYTIAETAGILVTVPAAWYLLNAELRSDFAFRVLNWDTLAYTALIVLVLGIALERVTPESVAYYLLILPLAWAAARQGMAGAVTAAMVLEACVTLAALRPRAYAEQMPNVQMLVLTLTLSGFLIGIAVDVARRASNKLQQSLRLAAAGEMAAAVAHELNQPLTALSAYGSACQLLVERDGGNPLLQKTIKAMVAESQRASNVLKRLREFFRTGSTLLEPIALADLIGDAVAFFVEQARVHNVHFQVDLLPEVELLGDRLQLDIVLRNLIANAVQALAEMPSETERTITVDAGVDVETIWIRIADTGPGISDKIRARLFEPFISLKSSGLGLGLAISRSIVEAHGGSLTVEPSQNAVLKLTLPAQVPLRNAKP